MSTLQRVCATIEKVCRHLEGGRIQSEADVRSYILSPLLRELGWNPADPGSVRREYAVTGGKSYFFDYALLGDGGTVAFVIEAKAPGKLDDTARDQLLLYAMKTKTRLGLTTDGKTWSFYLPLAGGTQEERHVRTVAFGTEAPENAASALERYLSRDRVLSGQALRDADEDRARFALRSVIRSGWENLIAGPDQKLVRTVASAARAEASVSGAKPPSGPVLNEAVRAFIRSGFRFPDESSTATAELTDRKARKMRKAPMGHSEIRMPVVRGRVAWTWRGKRRIEKNVTEMYVAIIGQLYEDCGGPGFYRRLMKELRGRKRVLIAPSRAETGLQPEHFKHLKELPGGWCLNTNLSTQDKMRKLRRACDAADIRFGSDLLIEAPLDTPE